jgi:uncharacterized lipoprotein YehR (DUF1307 family)
MRRELFKALTPVVLMLLVFVLSGCGEKEKPAAEKPEKEPAKEVFEVNVGAEVLAAYLWEDSFYGTEFFPAKVVTIASEETKGEYEVELKYENQMVKHWTENIVFKSHPAKKEELKVGMVILYTGGDDQPQSEETLKYAKWGRGVILSTDELHKDIVELQGGEYKRQYKRHLTAIRIIDEARKELTKIPAE